MASDIQTTGRPTLSQQAAYWQQNLAGELPLLDDLLDCPRPPVQAFLRASQTTCLDKPIYQKVMNFCGEYRVSLYTFLLGAFVGLLNRYTAQEDLLVGSIYPDTEFDSRPSLNPVVLRFNFGSQPAVSEFLEYVGHIVEQVANNQDYPFEELVVALKADGSFDRAPLFQVMFLMENDSPAPASEQQARCDLVLKVKKEDTRLTVCCEYDCELFEPAKIDRLLSHYGVLLANFTANPQAKLDSLPLLTPPEERQLLVEWNDTARNFPLDQSFTSLFKAQVERTPAAVAAICGEEHLTYAELDQRATGLAGALVKQGVGPEMLVALLADRGLDFLVAILAVFKAGGAYLPLDPHHPARRISQVLQQSRCHLVLAGPGKRSGLEEAVGMLPAGQSPQILDLAKLLAGADSRLPDNLLEQAEPGRLAYVIYTSGSTGQPKGAMVEQRGMVNHLYAKITDLQLARTDIVAQTAPQCFDISVWQFLAALLVGGTVRIFNDETAHDPALLLAQSEKAGITILESVPSFMQAMLESSRDQRPALPALRWMIPTGEALPVELCRRWLATFPQIPLLNAYGPTECSDDVTHYPIYIPPGPEVINMPIGRPVANMRSYILNSGLQPVPVGIAGEIFIGGVGVGQGYLNDPIRTAEAFIPDPFSNNPAARLYRTGDLARYLPDGTLEFLGRIDHQVKIRGFRMELGEIEKRLNQHPLVAQCVVQALEIQGQGAAKYLVAYVVPLQNQALDRAELRSFLKEYLPDYMVPAAWMVLEALPLTANGKINRRALPKPGADASLDELTNSDTFEVPRTVVEKELAVLWSEILGVGQVCRQADFFELGGHSLLAFQLTGKLHDKFKLDLPLRTLYERPRLSELARHIETAQTVDPGPVSQELP